MNYQFILVRMDITRMDINLLALFLVIIKIRLCVFYNAENFEFIRVKEGYILSPTTTGHLIERVIFNEV